MEKPPSIARTFGQSGARECIGFSREVTDADRIAVWEEEGGRLNSPEGDTLTGTINQIQWARQIRTQVDAEFDRVANALQTTALNQPERDRSKTHAMMAILEEKRAEVMANPKAGYFIHDWQELRDQVRRMIMEDDRYKATQGGVRSVQSVPFAASHRRSALNTSGSHTDARIGCTVVNVDGVAVIADRKAARKHDIGHVSLTLVRRFRPKDPGIATRQADIRLFQFEQSQPDAVESSLLRCGGHRDRS